VKTRRSWLAGLLSSWPLAAALRDSQSASASGETVEQALARFIAAFDELDWERFRNCFSQNATIFHPAAPNIKRIDSSDQFDKAWRGVFDRIKRNSGRTSPPYMKLEPADLRIERLSDDVALVTFHLFDGDVTNRRTLVFQRQFSSWKIVHIHASNIASSPRPS
jgi:ketosteroid isomerase-like protein